MAVRVSAADIVARFVLDLQQPEEIAPVTPLQARSSYPAYLRYVTRGHYREARHTKLLCEKLEAVERGEITRLMIFMPPRHSKSETSSKHFPGWFLGRNPHKRVMLASYGDELARDFGRSNRDDLEEYGQEIFGVSVSPGSSAAHRWDLAGKRGGMVTAGVGGPSRVRAPTSCSSTTRSRTGKRPSRPRSGRRSGTGIGPSPTPASRRAAP
jgi:hypothetical protein